jgi:hypothetical protein
MKGIEVDKWMRYITLLFASTWLLYFGIYNEVPTDTGDGLAHFFISQASWSNYDLFFDHWGKPLFILLSSPFAQMGFDGMMVFNLIVFVATVFFGYKILEKLNVNYLLQSLFPLILVLSPDIILTMAGGHTEPLFNLMLVWVGYLLLTKNYLWLAILVSFMPFSRSEGQLPLLLIGIILIYKKEWKYLPFLLTGFVVYAIAGSQTHGDLFWYFTKSPYSMNNGIYGKGIWTHYLLNCHRYLGKVGLVFTIIGLYSAVRLMMKKNWNELSFDLSFLAYGTFIGVVISHSYFWATGQNGSIGLTRIATQGVPLFILVQLIHWSAISARFLNKRWIYGLLLVPLMLLIIKIKTIEANPMERQIQQAVKFINDESVGNERILYHHPYVAYLMNGNPLIEGRLKQESFHFLEEDLKNNIEPGSIIVWDSHFGPVEAGKSASEMKAIGRLALINEFIFGGTGDEPQGVMIFQAVVDSTQQIDINSNTVQGKSYTLQMKKDDEFLNFFTEISDQHKGSTLTFSIKALDETSLVFDTPEEGYISYDMDTTTQIFNFKIPKSGEAKIYLWNPKHKGGKVEIDQVSFIKSNYSSFKKSLR